MDSYPRNIALLCLVLLMLGSSVAARGDAVPTRGNVVSSSQPRAATTEEETVTEVVTEKNTEIVTELEEETGLLNVSSPPQTLNKSTSTPDNGQAPPPTVQSTTVQPMSPTAATFSLAGDTRATTDTEISTNVAIAGSMVITEEDVVTAQEEEDVTVTIAYTEYPPAPTIIPEGLADMESIPVSLMITDEVTSMITEAIIPEGLADMESTPVSPMITDEVTNMVTEAIIPEGLGESTLVLGMITDEVTNMVTEDGVMATDSGSDVTDRSTIATPPEESVSITASLPPLAATKEEMDITDMTDMVTEGPSSIGTIIRTEVTELPTLLPLATTAKEAPVSTTATPAAASTATPAAASTATPAATFTATPATASTATPVAASTATPAAASTATPAAASTATPAAASTATPVVASTATPAAASTAKPVVASTATSAAASTATSAAASTATPAAASTATPAATSPATPATASTATPAAASTATPAAASTVREAPVTQPGPPIMVYSNTISASQLSRKQLENVVTLEFPGVTEERWFSMDLAFRDYVAGMLPPINSRRFSREDVWYVEPTPVHRDGVLYIALIVQSNLVFKSASPEVVNASIIKETLLQEMANLTALLGVEPSISVGLPDFITDTLPTQVPTEAKVTTEKPVTTQRPELEQFGFFSNPGLFISLVIIATVSIIIIIVGLIYLLCDRRRGRSGEYITNHTPHNSDLELGLDNPAMADCDKAVINGNGTHLMSMKGDYESDMIVPYDNFTQEELMNYEVEDTHL